MARTLALVFAFLALAGCLQPAPAEPTPPPFTFATPPPNFVGNWSNVEGSFKPVYVRALVSVYNQTTNATIPRDEACNRPFSYELDRENRTLTASKNFPLHPHDPGDLVVVFLHDVVRNPRCFLQGYYGINENLPTPDGCLTGVPASEREPRLPWRCHLPIEPVNDPRAAVWVNYSLPVSGDGYTLTINGRAFADGEAGTHAFWTEDDARDRRYRTQVDVEPLGEWPYSAIQRAG